MERDKDEYPRRAARFSILYGTKYEETYREKTVYCPRCGEELGRGISADNHPCEKCGVLWRK